MLPLHVMSGNPGFPPISGTYAVFEQTLAAHGEDGLAALSVETLQINVGKLCNQTCSHCHVDAGPERTEIMERDTIDDAIEVLRRHPSIRTVDITGGAPEPNWCKQAFSKYDLQFAGLLTRKVIQLNGLGTCRSVPNTSRSLR